MKRACTCTLLIKDEEWGERERKKGKDRLMRKNDREKTLNFISSGCGYLHRIQQMHLATDMMPFEFYRTNRIDSCIKCVHHT